MESCKENAVGEIDVFFSGPLDLGMNGTFAACCLASVRKLPHSFPALAGIGMNQPARDCCRFIDIFTTNNPKTFLPAGHCLLLLVKRTKWQPKSLAASGCPHSWWMTKAEAFCLNATLYL